MAENTPPHPEQAISVVVLAGGQSRRLGRDKSLLELDGEPLVERTIRRLSNLSDDFIVVANEPARYEALALAARLVHDERPGIGALMGIYSGLKTARYHHALTVACDMPFLNLPLLRHMVSLAVGHDVVVPRLGGMLEPLHAIYSKSCLPHMARLLDDRQRRIIAFFHEVRVCYVEEQAIDEFDPLHLSFVNVNTSEDWERVQELMVQHSLA